MRGMVIFLMILGVIASVSFAAASISNVNISNVNFKAQEQAKDLQFSTFTSAVCERGKDVVRCKDEFFVNCNGKISKVFNVAECDGIKLDVPKPTGFATFGKEWKDPRG